MNIDLTDEQITAMLSKTLFESLSSGNKDALLQKAIESILAPDQISYGSDKKKSRLQIAFERAVESAVGKMVENDLANNEEFKSKVKALWTDVSAGLFDNSDRYNNLVKRLVESVAKGIANVERY